MEFYQVHDKQFKPYLNAAEIDKEITRLANQLNKDYEGKNPLFIAILSGSFMFASDLFKKITIPAEICFIKLASYKGTRSTGNVITSIGLDEDVHGREIVIIEDIIDTGRTLNAFLPQLEHQQPSSMKICALLHKPDCTVFHVPIDYLGFTIPDKFVLGYGLDYDGKGRNLPEIYQLV